MRVVDQAIGRPFPFFSICVPNFNYARYIGATIDSVLAQTYQHFEIVVSDNASTDDSLKVLDRLASDRVRVVRNEYNIGFGPNLDRAAREATGDFIIMLSADDMMKPTALEEYAKLIVTFGQRSDQMLFASAFEQFDDTGAVHKISGRSDWIQAAPNRELTDLVADAGVSVYDSQPLFVRAFNRLKAATPFCATAYSRILYERVGGYSSLQHTAPDAHFSYKALLAGAPVVFVDRPLFRYRVHESNQFNSDRRQRTLKIPIDQYLFTIQFSDTEILAAGADRAVARTSLVELICLNQALLDVRDRNCLQAFRLLMFAFAAAPREALRNAKSYLLALLLLLTPLVGPPVARGLFSIRERLKTRASRNQ